MIYNLKNTNYKNFEVYSDNVLKPRSYFIPFGDFKVLRATDIRTERYGSDRVEVLSGEWDFQYFARVSDLPEQYDTERMAFDRVTVPSCWQFTGYEPPYYVNARYQFKPDPPHIPEDCSVGVYRRFFTVEDLSQHYTLSFLGVAGALDLFVNGHYVGYSEGSHNTAEFELDDYLTAGDNELVAAVHKYSNGTYLECQDMFRNNGIFRDVLLIRTGDNSVYDFELKTDRGSEGYRLTVVPSLKLTDPCELTVGIEELHCSKSVEVSPQSIDKIVFEGLKPEEWNAEKPRLYTAVITLSREGVPVEIIRRRFGFKHIEIRENVFYFNRCNIKLLGVNHHDTDPYKGYVMSVEDMERDVRLMKEYTVNCVRTSHYPPDPIFLDLCDEYGLYVIDEADIETHGCEAELHRPGACSHNKAWAPRYWDRVYRMFERDKNHPSITMWSLGNEAWGYANQDICYRYLKQLTDIPIHYEGVVRTRRFAYDVISQMYPWQGKMKKLADGKGLAKKWYSKPYFLCEYAHAMGVGAGELETYVRDFLRADNMLGGCIWEFADHAVYHPDGTYRWTYGGDHGEEKHDKNFCVDGLFTPDRKPHAGALQMKNCYRPVRLQQLHPLVFRAVTSFERIDLSVVWTAYHRGTFAGEGAFSLQFMPFMEKAIKLPLRDSEYDCVVLQYFNTEGKEIASERFGEWSPSQCHRLQSSRAPLTAAFREDKLVLTCDGEQLPLGVSLYRAPLDNDMYLRKVWDKMALASERLQLLGTDGSKGTYRLRTDAVKKLAAVTFDCTADKAGGLQIRLACEQSKTVPFLPRFGITLQLPGQYDNVRYYGLGRRQNLPDFQEHAMPGQYTGKVDELREKYIKPQESSMRCGVVWAEVTDDSGHGFRFEMSGAPMIFSADRFTSQQCAEAMHQEDLTLQPFTYLHIDGYQLGAASGACGPVPTKAYRKNSAKGCEATVRIIAI